MNQKTLKELIVENKNAAPGFDALRFCLATLILLWHTIAVCYPEGHPFFESSWRNPIFNPILKMILPMFFFLSGFLVTTSAYRVRSTPTFLLYRVFRILPALLVEVFISAVCLGALMTTVPLAKYYSSAQFFKYFLNIVGNVQFYLPGVFESHPSNIVNVNLWTLPAEFYCYAIMAVLMITGAVFKRKAFLIVFGVLSAAVLYLLTTIWTWGESGVVFVRPPLFVYSFFIGVFAYLYADRIIISKRWGLLSIAGLFFFDLRYTTLLGVLASCYLCLCIGFVDVKRFSLIRNLLKQGDFSYGIYLYSFPIEQTVWHVFPFARQWWALFLIAFPITLVFSILSWRFIEHPFLRLKRHLQVIPTPAALA